MPTSEFSCTLLFLAVLRGWENSLRPYPYCISESIGENSSILGTWTCEATLWFSNQPRFWSVAEWLELVEGQSHITYRPKQTKTEIQGPVFSENFRNLGETSIYWTTSRSNNNNNNNNVFMMGFPFGWMINPQHIKKWRSRTWGMQIRFRIYIPQEIQVLRRS